MILDTVYMYVVYTNIASYETAIIRFKIICTLRQSIKM